MAEETALEDGGGLVVTMVSGREARLAGPEADDFRDGLAGAMPSPPPPPPPPPPGSAQGAGVAFDPRGGNPPRRPVID